VSTERPSQLVRLPSQPASVQAPRTQDSPASQVVPQAPQWRGALAVSTQASSHWRWLVGHEARQPPRTHSAPASRATPQPPRWSCWLSSQALPQPPQWSASD